MLVVFEGMDGVGKSTIAKSVSDRINFKYECKKFVNDLDVEIPRYLNFVSSIRKSNDKLLSFMFYAFRCLYDNVDREDLVTERTMASLYFFEKDNVDECYFDLIMKDPAATPDVTFLLYSSPEARMERIRKRNPNDPDLKDVDALKDGYSDMKYFLDKYDMPYVVIDTEKYSVDHIVDIASTIVNDCKGLSSDDRKKYLEMCKNKFGTIGESKGKALTYEKK